MSVSVDPMEPTPPKNPVSSKTVILGVLTLVANALVAAGQLPLDPKWLAVLNAVSGALFIAIRFLTTGPVAWTAKIFRR